MVQRHKREVKELQAKNNALLSSIRKSDKKGKDEAHAKAEKLVEEMEQRHKEELASLDAEESVAASLAQTSLEESKPKGISKTQLRKQKKQEAEDARIKRIEEENRNIVPPRIIEANAILKQLNDESFTIKEIPPDGNCLYNAVADQLALIGSPSPRGHHLILRSSAVDYISAHRDEFSPFIISEADDFDSYCAKMRDPAVWGGQIELQALAHALKVPIVVYSGDAPKVTMGEQYTSSSPSLHLSFHKHAYALGEHYNSVVPVVR